MTAPCQCWTNPARFHDGHCCMRPGPDCHVTEGRAAHQATTTHQEGTP